MFVAAVPYQAELRIATHFFAVRPLSPKTRSVIYEFARPLLEFKWEFDPKLRRNVRVAGKVWGGALADYSEFRYPISLLPKLLAMFNNVGVPQELVLKTYFDRYQAADVDIRLKEDKVLRDYQEEAVSFAEEQRLMGTPSVLLGMPTGTGKAQPLTSRILTENGWKFMGEIKVGDKIISQDGSATNVTGVYPQGTLKNYKVTFYDGRTVECNGEHLWKVFSSNTDSWRVVTTDYIRENLEGVGEHKPTNFRVPLYESDEGNDTDLLVDPYVFGLLLGNGGFTQQTIRFTTGEPELVESINEDLQRFGIVACPFKGDRFRYYFREIPGYKGENKTNLREILRNFLLFSASSCQKFVPDGYLKGSRRQRLALVQGLMDTDGYASTHGHCLYSTSSESLMRDFVYLIHSLGGIASVRKVNPSYTYNGEKRQGRLHYVINLRYRNPAELFRLERKKSRVPHTLNRSKNFSLRIEKIEECGEKEMQCISVDHPSRLYVTDGFVVTHNTVTLLGYASRFKKRVAMIAGAGYGDKWLSDILANTEAKEVDINKVAGRGGIRKIFDAGDKYDKNFTIFSTETLQRYFKEYEENPELAKDIYGGVPMDLWRTMKCGFLGGDEMHESINTIYWMNTFIHGPFHMGMSATMLHKDAFIEARQKEIYPVTKRFDKIKMAKYISVIYLGYYFKDFAKSKIKTNGGRGMYSQDEFEHSITKSKISKDNFADMVASVVREYFVKKRQPGDKLRVYFSRIKMIDLITDTLKLEFPDLDIRRYAEDDEYAHVIEAEIGVTNRGKAGTGVDIPGLTTVINFTNVESSQAVLQLLGRLREIPGREVYFIQAYCKNVNKHLQYKENAHRLIQDRIKQSVHHDYPYPL